MTTWDKTVFLCGIFLSVSISAVQSCTCQMRHPQQHVCDADFVIRGKVLRRSPLQPASIVGQYEYHIQVQRAFKDHTPDGMGREIKLITPASEALCGIPQLLETKTYVITGNVQDGHMQVSVCDWVAEWESVTRPQHQGIKRMYKKYCSNCLIRINTPRQLTNPQPRGPLEYFQGCSYTSYADHWVDTEDCEAAYSSCVQHRHGGCSWLSNHSYQECLQKRHTKMQLQMQNQKLGRNTINGQGDNQ